MWLQLAGYDHIGNNLVRKTYARRNDVLYPVEQIVHEELTI